jgi:predicted phage tail protein
MNNLTNIKVHGILGEQIGKSEWNLAVSSVDEAIRAIESNCKKLYKHLIENDKKDIKYRVLINEKDISYDESKDLNTIEGLASSELIVKKSNLKTIDIVPVIEGASDFLPIIIGVALMATGVGMAGGFSALMSGGNFMAQAVFMGGVGLVAAGITNLLTPMPKFGDFREIEQQGGKSYLFNGPENTIREGGPVFVGYGRLLVGSHVIQSSSDIVDVNAGIDLNNHWGRTDYGLKYNVPQAINPSNWNG